MTTPPHLAVPFQLQPNGSLVVNDQDSIQDVQQSVASLLGCLPGTRTVVPTYGIDPTFVQPNPNAIEDVVAQWEPRADVKVSIVPGISEQVTVIVSLATGVSP